MTEIEKLYENCRIEKTPTIARCNRCWGGGMCVITEKMCKRKNKAKCKNFKGDFKEGEYPPFTAEKQLELIKWLMKYDEIHGDCDDEYGFSTLNYSGKYEKDFKEALASVINNELWQDLTDVEKEQIKEILK